jgi:ribosomal protein S18 acetylase RimI-like enzyme
VIVVEESADVDLVRTFFREYAAGLDFDLAFQGFEGELDELPGGYDRLLVARLDGEPVGCVALRPQDARIGELKRLYVRPSGRGRGVGRALAEAAIVAARELGYERLRLDTTPSMGAAIALYESLGFRDIEAYRFNPVAHTRFLELVL